MSKEVEKVASLLTAEMPLVGLRTILDNAFGRKNVGFSYEPCTHYMISFGNLKVCICHKDYVEKDENTIILGSKAIGLV